MKKLFHRKNMGLGMKSLVKPINKIRSMSLHEHLIFAKSYSQENGFNGFRIVKRSKTNVKNMGFIFI